MVEEKVLKILILADQRKGGEATGQLAVNLGRGIRPDGEEDRKLQLPDGSILWGSECWWEPAGDDTDANVQRVREFNEFLLAVYG